MQGALSTSPVQSVTCPAFEQTTTRRRSLLGPQHKDDNQRHKPNNDRHLAKSYDQSPNYTDGSFVDRRWHNGLYWNRENEVTIARKQTISDDVPS
jgi:hypothetical protein